MKAALVQGPNPRAVDGVFTVRAWLEEQGVGTVIIDARGYTDGDPDNPRFLADALEVRTSELVIVFGGDGTTLCAARLVGYSQIPILSFNFGHLGFLSSDSNGRMIDRVETVLSGEVYPVRHTALDVDVLLADGSGKRCFALNEALLTRGAGGHVISFSVNVNGVEIYKARGDGILVSTATGSTAYALSAGGPIVSPDFKGSIIVPVSCHTLRARPILTGQSDTVEVKLDMGVSEDPVCFLDGQPLHETPAGITVSRGSGDVLLYRFEENAFYQTVHDSFFEG